jgi:hypothetical protein
VTTTESTATRPPALVDGYPPTHLLYVAAELGLADAIGGAVRDGVELGAEVGADTTELSRPLHGLAAVGALDERPGRRLALTGEVLLADHPRSGHGAAPASGRLAHRRGGGRTGVRCARTGGPPGGVVEPKCCKPAHGCRTRAGRAAHPPLRWSAQFVA